MKHIALSLAAAVALTAAPASAQVISGGTRPEPGSSRTETLGNPADVGIIATTPSRIRSSRREMNRGRGNAFEVRMSRREARRYASDLVQRAAIQCEVVEAMVVARIEDNLPVLEVDCAGTGGLVIADTLPIQATDCLDLSPTEGPPLGDGPPLVCRLPANVASVAAARQSATN